MLQMLLNESAIGLVHKSSDLSFNSTSIDMLFRHIHADIMSILLQRLLLNDIDECTLIHKCYNLASSGWICHLKISAHAHLGGN